MQSFSDGRAIYDMASYINLKRDLGHFLHLKKFKINSVQRYVCKILKGCHYPDYLSVTCSNNQTTRNF